jgi:hypothetical protein
MRSILLITVLLFLLHINHAQSRLGFDQYSYLGTGQLHTLVPVMHYESNNKWYAEARYNYDEYQTFSLYAGKTFSRQNMFSYAFTPVIGAMTGKLNGGSVGLNTELSYKKFNFSSQSQYTVSAENKNSNFFFSWSELYYQPLKWMYTGVTLQHTRIYKTDARLEPGVLIGFSFDQWSFPVYSFTPYAAERYFVVGINWEWQYTRTPRRKPAPLVLTNSDLKQ